MAALELIEQLEEWGTFDASVIAKLREKVAQAPSEPTAEAVLNYLVKKKVITRKKGEELLDRFLNDPGQDSSVLLQTDLLSPEGLSSGSGDDELEELEDLDQPADVDMNQTVLDQGQYVPDASLGDPSYNPPGYENQEMYNMNQGGPATAQAASGWSQDQTADAGNAAFAGKWEKGNPWDGMWLWVGAGLLIFFSVVAVGLSYFLTRLSAEELWKKAQDAHNNHNFSEAKLRYGEFAASFPNDDKASQARVQAAMCDIHIPFRSNDYTKAMENAETILPEIQNEMGFSSARDDLADILPKVGSGLAEVAKRRAEIEKKQEDYEKAVRAQALVANSSYITSKKRASAVVAAKITEMEESIATVDRQLSEEATKEKVLGEIRGLVDNNDTAQAFALYRRLVRDFPTLEEREEVRSVRDQIAVKEQQLVKATPLEAMPSDPEATQATVQIANRVGESVSLPDSDVVSVVAEGALYALQGRDGQVLWRRFVGFEYDYVPEAFPGQGKSDWLISQGTDHSLIRMNAATGEVKWKFRIGERFTKPVFTQDFVFVSTYSGRILKIDAKSGSGVLQCQLPQGVTSPMALGGNDSLVYQVGDHWYMYVLDSQTLECREVFLLNHEAGTVTNPPVSQLGLLYVAESRSSNSNVHVLRAEERGWQFERPQPAFVYPGSLLTPMMPYGRDDVIVVDSVGNVSVLSAIGDEDDRPVQESVKMNFDSSPGVITRSLIARGGHFYLNGAGLYLYQLRKQMQEFQAEVSRNPTDSYVVAPRIFDETLITVRRRSGSAMLTVTASNSLTLEPVWQVDLGSPLPGAPFEVDGKVFAINSQGDQFQFEMNGQSTNLANAVQRGSTTGQALLFDSLLVNENGLGMLSGAGNAPNFMIFDEMPDDENNRSRLKLWDKKSLPLAVAPVRLRDFGVVCSAGGEVFLVDFRTGSRSRTGFQPQLAPGAQVKWLKPTVLDEETVLCATEAGGVYRLRVVQGGFSLDAEKFLEGARLLGRTGTLTGAGLVAARRSVEGGTEDVLLALGQDLSEARSVSLPAGLLAGPFVSGDQVLVGTDDQRWITYDANLDEVGAIDAAELGAVVGEPQFVDGKWHVVTRTGHYVQFAGSEISSDQPLGQPLQSGPYQVSGQWVANTPDGAILYLNP